VIIKAMSAAPIGGPVHVTDALFCGPKGAGDRRSPL